MSTEHAPTPPARIALGFAAVYVLWGSTYLAIRFAVASLPPEIAVLMIEHDMHLVRRFATEVYVLVHGRVLTVGPPAEVMASPEVREVYLGTSGQSRFAEGAPRA